MIKKYSMIVLYNKRLDESPTYNLCREYDTLSTIICDNSTIPNENQKIAQKHGIKYISMGGNKGLSKAYNAGISSITEKIGYIMILDDDTKIPRDYIDWFVNAELKDSDIFLPIVKDKKGIMSPSINKNGIITRAKKLDINYDEISGINSGMIINLKCFDNFCYNESLFLDYVDHYFLRNMKKKQKKIKVIPFEIYQNFSAINNNKSSAKIRWDIFKKDSQFFYGEDRLKYLYVTFKRRVHLMYQYKDFTFLWR